MLSFARNRLSNLYQRHSQPISASVSRNPTVNEPYSYTGFRSYRNDGISFGRFALQAVEPAWISSRQIEAGRRAMIRNARHGGKIWVRVYANKPITAKPNETRMGKGKGAFKHKVAVVEPGRVLYEVSGVALSIARRAISVAASKMPGKTKFIFTQHPAAFNSRFPGRIKGFSSGAMSIDHGMDASTDLPATAIALKNPTSKIVYDENNHERLPPGDPSKRAFTYFVLSGGRFVYASLIRLLVLKLVLSMSASKDVLALASLEVDLSSIEPGSTITVKWRGKPVFIRRRTIEDIQLANSVDIASLRDPQEDSIRVKNPEWLVVVGVCTHLGCIPLPNAGDFGGWFCPCHGSHYDISGRIRKGPAPYNLEVPTYSFLDENKLMIG